MWVYGNRSLTLPEMEENVKEMWNYLGSRGCTRNAIAGICGNAQVESFINPGVWENYTPTTDPSVEIGYGILQWTPWTKYAYWAGVGWENNGPKQCQRILYEADNNIQWFENYSAPDIGLPVFPAMTLKQFFQSTLSAEDLASMFLVYYEHPASLSTNQTRRDNASYWMNILNQLPDPTGIHIPLWMMCKPHWKR